MAKHLCFAVMLVIFTALSVCPSWALARPRTSWAKTVRSGNNERTSTLQFYFHETASGNSPTAIVVVQAAESNSSANQFGMLVVADDPLRVGPDPKSKLVGRAQGLYGSASRDDLGLLMALSYTFTDGAYNGSSISILGRNSPMHPLREMPIVGGTGLFRMARGLALARTYSFNTQTGDAIVGYNVTVVHYPKGYFS